MVFDNLFFSYYNSCKEVNMIEEEVKLLVGTSLEGEDQ